MAAEVMHLGPARPFLARTRRSAVPLADQSAIRAAAAAVAGGSAPAATAGGCLPHGLDAVPELRDLVRTVAGELNLDADPHVEGWRYAVRFTRRVAERPTPRQRGWLRRLFGG